jgi:hypothetical protein
MSAGDLLNYNDSVNVRVLAGVPGTGTTLPSAPTVGHLATWGAGFTLADGGAVTGPCTGTASAFQYNNSGAFGCAPLTYTVPAANQNLFTFTQGSDPSTPLISLNSSGGTPVWRLGIQSTAAFEGAFSPVIRLYSDNFATSVVALYGGVGGGQIFFANGGGTNWSSTGDTGGSSDTGQHRVAPGVIGIDNGTSGTFTEAKLRSLVHGGSVPGISGCSADTQVGGNTAGSYTSRTSGTCTVTLTFAFTAPTGWACATNDLTTPADVQHQSGVASRTTTATITGTTVTGDVVNFDCHAY